METTSLSDCLQNYLTQETQLASVPAADGIHGPLEVVGQFLYGLVIPSTWQLREIQRVAGHALV